MVFQQCRLLYWEMHVSFLYCFQGISVKMVAAGAEHTAAITEDGELYGWGWGRYGNLGLGDRKDNAVPMKVATVEVCGIFIF